MAYKPSKLIPVYEPFKAKNTKKYVNQCIDDNIYNFRSPFVSQFESLISSYLGVKHCVSVFNGSVSLMLILKSLGIGHKDEIITQNLTYAATVSSILNVGAVPVVIDSDANFQMDISLVEKAITKKTKAIMVAGLYGDCCDIQALKVLCDKNGIVLIEDAAEVFGCRADQEYLGSFGVASSFSFYMNKILCGAGELGVVCTNNDQLASQLKLLKNQGALGGFLHSGPAFNFRATAIQCAVGVSQFEHLDEILKSKKQIADTYRDNLKLESVYPKVESSEWMPLFRLPSHIAYIKFNELMLAENIETRPCFTPVSLMSGFKVKKGSSLKISESIYQRGINLPCGPCLTEDEQNYIIETVNKCLNYF